MEFKRIFILLILISLAISCDNSPVEPESHPVLKDVIKIASGRAYNLALKSDGTVWAWGWNAGGQLGNNTTVDNNVPVRVLVSQ